MGIVWAHVCTSYGTMASSGPTIVGPAIAPVLVDDTHDLRVQGMWEAMRLEAHLPTQSLYFPRVGCLHNQVKGSGILEQLRLRIVNVDE